MDDQAIWKRWEEVDRILDRALELPPEERRRFVEEECGGDPELTSAVSSLLGRVSGDGDLPRLGPELFDALVGRAGAGSIRPPESLIGEVLGTYRLTRILGVGGMGTVYLGERADGLFERAVAVKVLDPVAASPEMTDRFALERRILAALDHPGIARMIDGGLTSDGHPYLVMEHVEGTRIDRWADSRRIGVAARVELVIQVAEAVEYAHRHMVIHRDLKPGNILVTDGGEAKLLDFGIAKLLEDAPASGGDATTRHGSRFFTPEYAAPEQILGGRVSAQTDVYALSALLYELLTGVRPYATRDPDSVLERIVEGSEPTAPSVVVASGASRSGSAAGTAADADAVAARGTTPDGLRRRLAGDLDAILQRGLQSRPEDRYGSVAALRDDLQRHLAGGAVAARGDAGLYRARRFVRRNRVPVAAAVVAFLAVTVAAVGLAIQRAAVVAERNRAEEAAAVATREAETARQVTAFLAGLFESADPGTGGGDTLTVHAVLARGVDRIGRELADRPAVRAALLSSLGEAYVGLGEYPEALRLLEWGVALRRDSIAGRPGLASALIDLAAAHRAEPAYAPALAAYGEAASLALASDDREVAGRALVGRGTAWVMVDQLDSAEMALQRGLELLQGTTGRDFEHRAALNALAGIARRRGDLDRAERLYEDLLHLVRTDGASHDAVDYPTYLNNLAVVKRMQEDYAAASALYREALDTLERVLEPGHPRIILFAGNLARALDEGGRRDESVAVYRDIVDGARTRWPDGHWRMASALNGLGASLILADRAGEAVGPLSEAVDMMASQVGPDHSWTNVYRGWLAAALTLSGEEEAAEPVLTRSLRGLATYEGLADDPNVTSMVRALADHIGSKGLESQAAAYRELIEPSG